MSETLVQEITKVVATTNQQTITASLPSLATFGTILFTVVGVDKDAGTIDGPNGWSTPIVVKASTSVTTAICFKVSDGTEQDVTWDYTIDRDACMWVGEYSGLDGTTPDVSIVTDNSGASSVTSQSTGTSTTTSQANTFAIAFMGTDTGINTETGRTISNGFTENHYLFGQSGGHDSMGLAIATKSISSVGTVETTFSTTDTGDQQAGGLIVWAIADVGGALIPVIMNHLRNQGIN